VRNGWSLVQVEDYLLGFRWRIAVEVDDEGFSDLKSISNAQEIVMKPGARTPVSHVPVLLRIL
jgi:hypothetical protein